MREKKNTYWKRDKIRSRTKWKRTNERSKEWTTHKRTNTSWYSSVFLCVNWYEFLYFFSHAALDRRVLVCMCARLISPIEHFLVLIVCCHCWCYLLSQTLVLTTEHILSMSDDFPIKKLVRWRTLYTHARTNTYTAKSWRGSKQNVNNKFVRRFFFALAHRKTLLFVERAIIFVVSKKMRYFHSMNPLESMKRSNFMRTLHTDILCVFYNRFSLWLFLKPPTKR